MPKLRNETKLPQTIVSSRTCSKKRIKGEVYIVLIRTYDDKNVIVSFIFNDIKYKWITSSHWKKASAITYINYREKFLASFNDEGFDVYGENKVASNMRLIKDKT